MGLALKLEKPIPNFFVVRLSDWYLPRNHFDRNRAGRGYWHWRGVVHKVVIGTMPLSVGIMALGEEYIAADLLCREGSHLWQGNPTSGEWFYFGSNLFLQKHHKCLLGQGNILPRRQEGLLRQLTGSKASGVSDDWKRDGEVSLQKRKWVGRPITSLRAVRIFMIIKFSSLL